MKRHSISAVTVLGVGMAIWAVAGATEKEVAKDPQLALLHIQLRGVSQ
ncbi:MAG: hypothetical protein ACYTG0_36365 [Planctomycetota bacterium]|jgi:hypothetical protein